MSCVSVSFVDVLFFYDQKDDKWKKNLYESKSSPAI